MPKQTITLKLPFYRLNLCKQEEFEQLTLLNTGVANELLTLPKEQRKKLTSKDFAHVEIGSMWINQTIRNANAKTKVKQFKRLPLEVNNQGWKVRKVGETYSLSFSLYRGRKKRIPVEIHQSSHANSLEQLLNGTAKMGSLKICKTRKGAWLALISVTLDVPEPQPIQGWIGVDRGQNVIATASLPSGMAKFWHGGPVKQLRRKWANVRRDLQSAKKHKTVKRLESKERRMMTHINHVISKQIVQFAKEYGYGLCFEDLSGIRHTSKQRKKTKSDAGNNRDQWAFYQLEQFTLYKAIKEGVAFKKRPAAYTSKTCCKCGVIGKRRKHNFLCVNPHCNAQHHSDWGASQNIGQWDGKTCSLEFQKSLTVMVLDIQESGVNDGPLNLVTEDNLANAGLSKGEQESHSIPERLEG